MQDRNDTFLFWGSLDGRFHGDEMQDLLDAAAEAREQSGFTVAESFAGMVTVEYGGLTFPMVSCSCTL